MPTPTGCLADRCVVRGVCKVVREGRVTRSHALRSVFHQDPCLLVRQVDQFGKLRESTDYRHKTPAASCGG